MARPTLSALRDLWKYAYARSAMNEARSAITLLRGPDLRHPMIVALTTAMVIAYARPFTKSQISQTEVLVALKGHKPPKRLQRLHDDLLKIRNKVIGHKDATLPPMSGGLNTVLFKVDANGFDLSTRDVLVDFSLLDPLEHLTLHFIELSTRMISAGVGANKAEFRALAPGNYELDLCDAPKPWARPV